MNGNDLDRREFVQLMVALSAGFAIGCESNESRPGAGSLSPAEESLLALVLALGPWPESDRAKAEDFAGRFVAYAGGLYLSESTNVVQSLANRLPADAMALTELDLKDLTAEERELTIQLTQQLYSFIEVRFYVANEPPWGECLGDRTRYTLAPS
jgi:hypothetical protein